MVQPITPIIRVICAILLLAAAVFIGMLILPLFNEATIITDTPGDARIYFEVDRPYTRWDSCLTASWRVEGVQTVALGWFFDEPQGVIGKSQREICIPHDGFVKLMVTLPDGTRHEYRIEAVRSTIWMMPLYSLLMAGLLITAVSVMGWGKSLWQALIRQRTASPLKRWQELTMVSALALITLLIHLPLGFIVRGGDYEVHVYYTRSIAEGATITSPHFMYQLFILAFAPFLPGEGAEPFFVAGFITHLLFAALTPIVIYGFLRYLTGKPRTRWAALAYIGLTFGVMLAAPLAFPTFPAKNMMFGYLPGGNVFHNPTWVLMRPMSVLLVWIIIRMLRREVQHPLWVGLAAGGITALSLITKPIHVIIVVPAIGVFALWHLIRERRIDWLLILGVWGFAAPVLLFQYFGFFTEADAEMFTESSRVIVAPLAAMLTREPSVIMIGIKFLLSVAFPLGVYVAYFREARRDVALNFAWLSFLFGLAYAYLLAEEGKVAHANFIWSAQIGLDLLLMVSAGWFWREKWTQRNGQSMLLATLLMLHIVSGIIWHGVNITSRYGFFWW